MVDLFGISRCRDFRFRESRSSLRRAGPRTPGRYFFVACRWQSRRASPLSSRESRESGARHPAVATVTAREDEGLRERLSNPSTDCRISTTHANPKVAREGPTAPSRTDSQQNGAKGDIRDGASGACCSAHLRARPRAPTPGRHEGKTLNPLACDSGSRPLRQSQSSCRWRQEKSGAVGIGTRRPTSRSLTPSGASGNRR